MTSLPEQRIRAILKNHITPLLKNEGFRRSRNRYYRQANDLTWMVEVERSRLNDCTESSFTLHCGVYVPGLISRYAPVEEPTWPDSSACALSARLGWLAEEHPDTWWTLSVADDAVQVDTMIGREIAGRLERDGLPFLKRFQTRWDVLSFLVEPRQEHFRQVLPQSRPTALIYATIVSLLLGDRGRSCALWDEAVQAVGTGTLASSMRAIEKRIFGVSELQSRNS